MAPGKSSFPITTNDISNSSRGEWSKFKGKYWVKKKKNKRKNQFICWKAAEKQLILKKNHNK